MLISLYRLIVFVFLNQNQKLLLSLIINQNQCLLLQLQEQTNLTVLLNNYFCTLNAKPYGLKRVVQTVKTI